MALDTVADYVTQARTLLLDEIEPYRYPTADLVDALNNGILEARRLRPDLFLAYFNTSLPSYSSASLGTSVFVDPQYRMSFVYYIVGQAQLRDDEPNQDTRASAFMSKFIAQMISIQS